MREVARPALGRERPRGRRAPPSSAWRRRIEDRHRRVALAHRLEEAAAVRSAWHRRSARRGGRAPRPSPPDRRPTSRSSLDVRQAERHHAGRQRGAPARPQPLDELARGGGPARRIGRQTQPDRRLELLGLGRVDSIPRGSTPDGGATRRAGRTPSPPAHRRRWPAMAAPSAASSGARKPGVPVRRRGASGADDRPKSTSLTVRPWSGSGLRA